MNRPYGYCERCNWRCNLSEMRKEWTGLKVCPDCFDPRPSNLSPPRVRPEGMPLLNAAPEPTPGITLVSSANFNTADQAIPASGEVTLSLSSLTLLERDVLVVVYCDVGDSTSTFTATANTGGPCEKLVDEVGDDTLNANLAVFLAVQGPTPDTSITISGGTAGLGYAARILQYRGVDPVSPTDVATTTATGTDGDDANPPSNTPESAGTKIVAIYAAARDGSTTWTAPANVNNFVEISTSDTVSTVRIPVIGTGDKDWTSGAFDPDAATGGSSSASAAWAAATIALKSAG